MIEQAKLLTGIKTTRGVIDEALRLLIRLRQQAQVAELRGRLYWEGDLAELREGRPDDLGAAPERLVFRAAG